MRRLAEWQPVGGDPFAALDDVHPQALPLERLHHLRSDDSAAGAAADDDHVRIDDHVPRGQLLECELVELWLLGLVGIDARVSEGVQGDRRHAQQRGDGHGFEDAEQLAEHAQPRGLPAGEHGRALAAVQRRERPAGAGGEIRHPAAALEDVEDLRQFLVEPGSAQRGAEVAAEVGTVAARRAQEPLDRGPVRRRDRPCHGGAHGGGFGLRQRRHQRVGDGQERFPLRVRKYLWRGGGSEKRRFLGGRFGHILLWWQA